MGFEHLRPDRAPIPSEPSEPRYQLDEVPLASVVSPNREASLLGFFRAVWQHRKLICADAVVFMAAAGFYVSQQKPMYTADGAVVIASRKVMIPGVEAVSTPTGDMAIVRSEMAVLRSRNLLSDVATTLHLDQDPEFNPFLRPKDNSLLAWLDPRPFLRRLLRPANLPPADRKAVIAAAIEDKLEKNLTLINNLQDYVITIRYKSESPQRSAAIVDTLMDKYLAEYAQIKVAAAEQANAALEARAKTLQREVAEADAAVAEFVRNNRYVATRTGSSSGQQLEDLNSQLAAARADRAAAEARYHEAVASAHGAANAEVLASPLIQKLREQEAKLIQKKAELDQKVGPRFPEQRAVDAELAHLRRTIAGEIAKITTSLKSQAEVARSREAGLAARLAQMHDTTSAANASYIQFEQLKATADQKRRIYADFLAKMADTAQPGDRQPIEARILSRATVPVEPSNARGLFLILVAGIVGSLAAVAGSLAYDQLDRGFRTLDHVRSVTGLPAYAALPAVRGRWRWARSARYVVEHPHSSLAETLRGVRARLRWTSRDPRVILVTSATTGEGKTSFALALAQVTAMDGWRTLLIECDARRPVLGRVLPPMPSVRPGDIFAGRASWQDRIGRDERSGVFYLLATGSGGGFPALVEQQAGNGPIEQMKSAFDYVIIDSPPIMPVADASILARFVESVILIVAAKRTRQRMVAEALRRLAIAAKPIGIVLTNSSGSPAVEDFYTGYEAYPRRPRLITTKTSL